MSYNAEFPYARACLRDAYNERVSNNIAICPAAAAVFLYIRHQRARAFTSLVANFLSSVNNGKSMEKSSARTTAAAVATTTAAVRWHRLCDTR